MVMGNTGVTDDFHRFTKHILIEVYIPIPHAKNQGGFREEILRKNLIVGIFEKCEKGKMVLKVMLFYFDYRDFYQFYKHFNHTWTLLSCPQQLFSTLSSGHPILDAQLQPLRHGVG
jgi:hypothetical protein